MSAAAWILVCTDCAAEYAGLELRYRCACGGTLDVIHDLAALRASVELKTFDFRSGSRSPLDRSGVWRFRELILPVDHADVITRGEGNTHLYESERLAAYAGIDAFFLKHEGLNPTGSFKDRGMTVGVTVARILGMDRVACASTGNTSASMAAYAAAAGMEAWVFIPEGQIALGKLGQALAYGARTVQIEGDFDDAMRLVEEVCSEERMYLLNSVNPFRIEGQKATAFELLQDLDWQVPDWIIVPGGNAGHSSAIAKGLGELRELGLISKVPRLAVVQAEGASPLHKAFATGHLLEPVEADTLATAMKIGNPVSWKKCLRGVAASGGVVETVSDQEIMDAKAHVDSAGIGADPASCATVAGARKLAAGGIIATGESVCGILTGHLLKDPNVVIDYHSEQLDGIRSTYANKLMKAAADKEAILRCLRRRTS